MDLLAVVGPQTIDFRADGVKLDDRWKGEDGAKRIEEINEYYAMGQSLTLKNVLEVVDFLTLRDYPELYDYNGKRRLGSIFVPDSYNPRKPNMVFVEKDNKPKERTKKDFTDAVGDMAERSVYEVLKATFNHKKFKGSVLVIQGLNMLEIDPLKRQVLHDREMDFLIVHKESSTVINIEVKNSLSYWQRSSVHGQLIENHRFFEDWFGADISPKWTWVSMIYTEQAFPEDLKVAFEKNEFIASGRPAFKEKLLNILSKQQINTPVSDFKLICKYLLFCSPAKPLAIGMNQIKRMEEAMAKQGSVDNIKVWCFPTPEQKAILKNDRVLFLAAWGSGKTLLMQSKAIELAERGEDVLFLIYQNDLHWSENPEAFKKTTIPTLLTRQLELRYKKACDKITVRPVWEDELADLEKIGDCFKHVMIDELPGEFSNLKKEDHKKLVQFVRRKQTVWLAISGDSRSMCGKIAYSEDELDKVTAKWFPGCYFKTARMKLPLRTPEKVFDALKKQIAGWDTQKSTLNRFLLSTALSPPSLTQGKVSNIRMEKTWSMAECMKKCLADVPKGAGTMIIIPRIQKVKNGCDQCNDQLYAQIFKSAFIQLEGKEPLFYTNEVCSAKEDIENWLSKSSDRHLVVSANLVLGFEHKIVINLADPVECSRSSGHVVTTGQMYTNYDHMALPMFDFLERSDHDCRDLQHAGMETPLNVIGKIYLIFTSDFKK